MVRTVVLAANLPANPDALFDMYLDAKRHAEFTGAEVHIESLSGAPFTAFDGMLSGTMLHVEPKRLIVQTWRSGKWRTTDVDSVLTLTFWPHAEGGRVELVHANVPEEDFAGVCQGWEKFYWEPWRRYLESGATDTALSP